MIGLSCVFWLEDSRQAIIIIVFCCLIAGYLWHSRQLIANKLNSILIGLIWGCISVIVWMFTTPQLVPKPQVSEISGYICSLPAINHSSVSFQDNSRASKQVRFDFCISQINKTELKFYQSNKIRLTVYRATDKQLRSMTAGSFWHFSAKLKPIHSRLNPGGFDYEKWLVSEGFVATGYVKSSRQLPAQTSIKAGFNRLRGVIYRKLTMVLPNTESKGMILALAIGERNAISAEQWQSIQGSGTSHLLAISGLHIGIAALWSYYLFLFIFTRIRLLTRHIPAQTLAQVGSILGALAIALLSGFGYPAQRALIMLAVFLYTRWSGRHLSLANILALSVIIIVMLQPFAILSVSFWLSVLAVSIITFLLSYKQTIRNGHSGIKQWLRINWFLFVSLMPLTWVVFDSVSIVGFIANLLLIPLTSFVTTPLVYIGLLALSVSETIASWIFVVVDQFIALTYLIQKSLSLLNNLASVSSLPVSIFLLLILATLLILMPSKMPGKKLLIPISFVAVFSFYASDKNENFRMVVFDIGQGLSIHITVNNQHLLYDTGYGNSQFSMAQTSLIPYFKRQGVERLDKLVISHGDSDHSGGLKTIIKHIEVGEVHAGETLSIENVMNCHKHKPWRWGKAEFTFLPHLTHKKLTGNNASCVLQIKIGNKKILLTGDIEKKAENSLIKNGIDHHDILVAPHHGSLTSSTSDFVKNISPNIVIFSTGFANQWHFPKTEVIERYRKNGSEIYITHENGAVIVEQNQSGELLVSTERSNHPHFWQIKSTELLK